MVDPADVPQWQRRVLDAGVIVQDEDETADRDEAERRFRLFVDLLDDVTGDEGEQVVLTLLRCLRPQEDYGAYETLLRALDRGAPQVRGAATARGLADLVERNAEMAGAVLADLARAGERATSAFRTVAAGLPEPDRGVVLGFVEHEERDGGWLDRERRGRLRPEVPPG